MSLLYVQYGSMPLSTWTKHVLCIKTGPASVLLELFQDTDGLLFDFLVSSKLLFRWKLQPSYRCTHTLSLFLLYPRFWDRQQGETSARRCEKIKAQKETGPGSFIGQPTSQKGTLSRAGLSPPGRDGDRGPPGREREDGGSFIPCQPEDFFQLDPLTRRYVKREEDRQTQQSAREIWQQTRSIFITMDHQELGDSFARKKDSIRKPLYVKSSWFAYLAHLRCTSTAFRLKCGNEAAKAQRSLLPSLIHTWF